MEAAYTYHPSTPDRKADYMVVASKAEWQEVLANLDGVGHSKAAMDLIDQLKTQGIHP